MLNEDSTLNEQQRLAEESSVTAAEAGVSSAPEGQAKADVKEPSSLQEFVDQTLDDKARVEAEQVDASSASKSEADKQKSDLEGQSKVEGEKEPTDPNAKAELSKEEQEKLDATFADSPRFRELNEKVNTLKPDAEAWQYDQSFRQQYNIQPDQHKQAMELLALINTEPAKARDALSKLVEQIDLTTGAKLPDDLQKDVDEGRVSADRATELNKLRMQTKQFEARSQQTEQQQQMQGQKQVEQSFNDWDVARRKTDPDFKPKADANAPDGKWELVLDRIKLQAMSQPPRTPQEAVKLAESAYNYANQLFKRMAPRPPTRRTLSSNGSHQNGSANGNDVGDESMSDYINRTAGKKHGVNIRMSN